MKKPDKVLDVGYFIQYYVPTTEDYPFGRILAILGPSKWGIGLLILDDKTRKKLTISDGDVARICNPDQKPIPMYRWYPFFKSPVYYPRKDHYGFYSQQAVDEGGGTSIYLTVDGREVEVTLVSCERNAEDASWWDDSVYVGEVLQWVRQGKRGRHEYEHEEEVMY